jgi:hypothetical protein
MTMCILPKPLPESFSLSISLSDEQKTDILLNIDRISMITGTYDYYWKMRTSFMRGTYAYRNTLHVGIHDQNQYIRKGTGNRFEEKKK